jgi:aminoglycoside phosphotransferase (APT) family kinase protein
LSPAAFPHQAGSHTRSSAQAFLLALTQEVPVPTAAQKFDNAKAPLQPHKKVLTNFWHDAASNNAAFR